MLPSVCPGKVDHTHFGPEGNNVAVLKPVINRDGLHMSLLNTGCVIFPISPFCSGLGGAPPCLR